MLLEESQVNRLGFFGLWNYSIPSCEIQQEHSYLEVLFTLYIHLQQPVHTHPQIIIGVPTTEFRQVFNLYTISYPYLKSRKRVHNEYKIQIITWCTTIKLSIIKSTIL